MTPLDRNPDHACKRTPFSLTVPWLLVLMPIPAWAHPGSGDAAGLLHGLLHPLSGPDHVLAALGVGLLAWMLNGRARWMIPASFVAVMTLAALVAAFRFDPLVIEAGIGLSVLGTGLLLARGKPVPQAIALTVVSLFALFHGQAHGSEVPANASGLLYGLGLMLTTGALLGVGVLAGHLSTTLVTTGTRTVMRASGLALSVCGALLLVTTLAI